MVSHSIVEGLDQRQGEAPARVGKKQALSGHRRNGEQNEERAAVCTAALWTGFPIA